jgi:tRNA-2-methylthio-N6-dimethylallyladenosine synthase
MYSNRAVAPASRFDDQIDAEIKKERLKRLLQRQEVFTLERNKALVDSVQEILVEGRSTRPGLAENQGATVQWSGRTPGNKIVNFEQDPECAGGDKIRPGHLVCVRIEKAYTHSLWGRPVGCAVKPGELKGDTCHAA